MIGALTTLVSSAARMVRRRRDVRAHAVHFWKDSALFAAVLLLVGAAGAQAAGQARGNQAAALDACGLPTDYLQTSHCFDDATHHTCCMLGPEAQAYADASGNPIGTAARRAYRHLHGEDAPEDAAVPWCTCFGSLVCSFYAEKFPDDGTGVKFIYDPAGVGGRTGARAAVDVPRSPGCEAKARTFFDVMAHATPGVDAATSYADGSCPSWDPADHVASVAAAAAHDVASAYDENF